MNLNKSEIGVFQRFTNSVGEDPLDTSFSVSIDLNRIDNPSLRSTFRRMANLHLLDIVRRSENDVIVQEAASLTDLGYREMCQLLREEKISRPKNSTSATQRL